MKRLAMALTGMLLCAQLQAADPDGKFHIVGAGAVSCQKYLDATDDQRLYAETWWAGYLTALNRSTANTYHLMGNARPELVNQLLAQHCTARPDDLFAVAVHAVVERLYPDRLQRSPQ